MFSNRLYPFCTPIGRCAPGVARRPPPEQIRVQAFLLLHTDLSCWSDVLFVCPLSRVTVIINCFIS